MPRFLGGFGNSHEWSRQGNRPRCGPSKSEQISLMAAAKEQNKKNKNDLAAAERKLAVAQGNQDWKEAKKIARQIKGIKSRGRGR